MANTILTTAYYGSIRKTIDFRMTADDIPDDVISLPIFAGSAELDVKAIVEDVDSLIGDDLDRVRNAMIYRAAYKLVPSIPQLIELSILSDREKYQTIDWLDKLEWLLKESNRQLSQLDAFEGSASVFHFTEGGYKQMLYQEYIHAGFPSTFPPLYQYREALKSLGYGNVSD